MEQLPENTEEQVKPSETATQTTPGQVSLGKMLREAREQLNLSIVDVAAQIKFAPRQIEALEADDFKQLPEMAFLRGFVRSYAKILNLDAQKLLAAIPQAQAPEPELVPPSVNVPFPVAFSWQKQNLLLLGAALLLAVIVAGFAVWHFSTPLTQATIAKVETPVSLPAETQVIPEKIIPEKDIPGKVIPGKTKPQPAVKQHNKETPVPTQPKQSPPETAKKSVIAEPKQKPVDTAAGQNSGGPENAQKSSVRIVKTRAVSGVPAVQSGASAPIHVGTMKTASLRLVFGEESWTEVMDGDGKMISSQINPAGSELNLKGLLPLSLVIGHALATQLYVDGNPVNLAPYSNSTSEVARITLQ